MLVITSLVKLLVLRTGLRLLQLIAYELFIVIYLLVAIFV